jgi:hypothetical protein
MSLEETQQVVLVLGAFLWKAPQNMSFGPFAEHLVKRMVQNSKTGHSDYVAYLCSVYRSTLSSVSPERSADLIRQAAKILDQQEQTPNTISDVLRLLSRGQVPPRDHSAQGVAACWAGYDQENNQARSRGLEMDEVRWFQAYYLYS